MQSIACSKDLGLAVHSHGTSTSRYHLRVLNMFLMIWSYLWDHVLILFSFFTLSLAILAVLFCKQVNVVLAWDPLYLLFLFCKMIFPNICIADSHNPFKSHVISLERLSLHLKFSVILDSFTLLNFSSHLSVAYVPLLNVCTIQEGRILFSLLHWCVFRT